MSEAEVTVAWRGRAFGTPLTDPHPHPPISHRAPAAPARAQRHKRRVWVVWTQLADSLRVLTKTGLNRASLVGPLDPSLHKKQKNTKDKDSNVIYYSAYYDFLQGRQCCFFLFVLSKQNVPYDSWCFLEVVLTAWGFGPFWVVSAVVCVQADGYKS